MNKTTEQTLREALEFYATPHNWSGIGLHNAILLDSGRVAREALDATEDVNNMVDLLQRIASLEQDFKSYETMLKRHSSRLYDLEQEREHE